MSSLSATHSSDPCTISEDALTLALRYWAKLNVAARKNIDQLPRTLMETVARLPSDLSPTLRAEHVDDWTRYVWRTLFGKNIDWTPSATVMQLWVYHMIGPMSQHFRTHVLEPFWATLKEESDGDRIQVCNSVSVDWNTFESLQLVFGTALHLLVQYIKTCGGEHCRFAEALLSACQSQCDDVLEDYFVNLLASDLPASRVDEVCASLSRQPWIKNSDGSKPQEHRDIIKIYMEAKHHQLLTHFQERVVDWLQAMALRAQDEEIKVRYAAANPRAILVRYWQHNLTQISMFQIDAMRAWLMYFAGDRPDELSMQPPPSVSASNLDKKIKVPSSDEDSVVKAALKQLWGNICDESTVSDEDIIPLAYCKVLSTLSFICNKLKQHPVTLTHLKINLDNAAVRSKFGCYPGALALLRYVGYVPRADENMIVLPLDQLPSAQPRIDRALALIAHAQAQHS